MWRAVGMRADNCYDDFEMSNWVCCVWLHLCGVYALTHHIEIISITNNMNREKKLVASGIYFNVRCL